ncbi:MAG: glycosyltransferase family 2 protein [Anaerolineae bacterium]|nr:glycosyltransferase family 2 protein [Anaerolineae bacterium]MDW7992420.1 glycosyltransferase family 2 protein [Anaerolineae bacterium]
MSSGYQKEGVVAVIPAYNEARFIGSVVLQARKYVDTVIVVDDGSVDATAEIASAAGALVVRHEQNRGKGKALCTGLQIARSLSPHAVVLLDGDGQHLPSEIPRVLAPILSGEADMVVGSRYLNRNSQVPRVRVWGHRFFNFLVNRTAGLHLTDSQNGFRAFSSRVLDALNFFSNGFSVESEMQWLARQYGWRVQEVPVTVLYADKPKRSPWVQGLMVLDGFLRFIGQRRPMLTFSLIGLLFLLTGMGWGVCVVEIYRRTQLLAVGYALLCVMLTILGSICISTGFILHSVRELITGLLKNTSQ